MVLLGYLAAHPILLAYYNGFSLYKSGRYTTGSWFPRFQCAKFQSDGTPQCIQYTDIGPCVGGLGELGVAGEYDKACELIYHCYDGVYVTGVLSGQLS